MHIFQVSQTKCQSITQLNNIGAMVLGYSLKDKGAKARLVVLATIDNLSASTISELKVILCTY